MKTTPRLTEKVTLRLGTKELDALNEFADQEGVPLSYILRHLITRYVSFELQPKLDARRYRT